MDAVQDDQNTTASTHYTKLSSGLNQHPPQTTRLQGHEEKDAQSLRLRVFHKTDWFLEIASAFLALLALLGMVILLSRIQNRPLSSWDSAVSPNAFISVLSTLSKACLVLPISECLSQLKWLHIVRSKRPNRLQGLQDYDNASRGPLGAVKFFWKAPSRSWVPFVGCFLTLVAIAFDPFTQQILTFDSRLTETQDAHASVGASQVYDYGNTGAPSMGGDTFQLPRDNPLQAAITGALYDQAKLPAFTCQGVVCDYPSFASLGVNGNCQDVTATTVVNCTGQDTSEDHCQLTTPDNSVLFAQSFFSAHFGFGHTRLNTSIMPHADSSGSLVSVSIVRLLGGDDDSDNRATWMDKMQVYDCIFGLSAIEYANWRIVNGTIIPGSRTPYTVNLTEPGPMLGYTVLDSAFKYNGTFHINYLDVNNLEDMLTEAFKPAEPNIVTLSSVALYISQNIPTSIANMSAAISDRMLSGPNATEITGRVLAQVTFIDVQWGWISLPAALVVASCTFLAVVMLLTHRAEQLIWKSSLTPLLMTELSYPLSMAHQRPVWNQVQLKARTTEIVNHLTK